jgi:hypothetical protein
MIKPSISMRAVAVASLAMLVMPAMSQAGTTTDAKDKNTVAAEDTSKIWQISADGGYETRYIFRGTNLTPGSDGLAFGEAQMSLLFGDKGVLTMGVWYGSQLGDARANTWAIGEGGGAGSTAIPGAETVPVEGGGVAAVTFRPTTVQTRFRETDFYIQYKMTLGPVDVTVGNIAFIIDRHAYTLVTEHLVDPRFVFVATGTRNLFLGRFATVNDEAFDRMYVRLSTSKIPYITPSLTYYQTIINSGGDYFREQVGLGNALFSERNDNLGGYLEAKLAAHFTLVPDRLYLDPYALISINFEDRAKPGGTSPFRAETFTGFHHFQTGAELPIYFTKFLSLVPFGGYAYISDPVIGTRQNEFWGGAKLRLEF